MAGRLDKLIARLGASDPSAMLSARRRIMDQPFDLVKYEGEEAILLKPPRMHELNLDVDNVDHIRRHLFQHIRRGQSQAAFTSFAPNDQGGVGAIAYFVGDLPSKRHELMHAYNQAARRGEPGMPLASRFIAAVEGGHPVETWRGGAGRLLDEYTAQRAGGSSFGEIPWSAYAQQYDAEGLKQAAALARAMQGAQYAGDVATRPEALALAALAAGTAVGVPYALSLDDEDKANAAAP